MSVKPLHIRQIKLSNYKNYTFGMFEFSENLNLIVGNNGVGKTNLLDAVYYTCLTKSYLTSTDIMATNFDSAFFRIESSILLDTDNQLLEIKYLKHEKKEVFLNKAKMEKQAEFVGKFPCVIITPDDNQLILGSSEQRRKFMDATIAQFSPEYLTNLISYNKILAQRNALLKSFYENRTFDKNLLDVYNGQLIACGKLIVVYRKSFLEQFLPLFQAAYRQIFDGQEHVSITYESDLLENGYEQVILESLQQDRNAQRTTKGIHTDDLRFELNGYPVKKTGSQGQQKTFLLSLKLAQYELLKTQKQLYPLLLLDDIFDKLDSNRIRRIFELLNSDCFGQVFITDTNEAVIMELLEEHGIQEFKIIRLG
ncbi:MAG: DNA replication and repair protein RecF [Sphingobacteriales bacterium]|nr:DNA replication and repair protein RecF [Sphingobacteriales bacterium]